MVIYRRVYNVIVGSKEEGAAVGFLEALGIQVRTTSLILLSHDFTSHYYRE